MGSDVLIVLVIVLVAVLVVRGPKTLPKWGSTLGRGVRDAKIEAARFACDRSRYDATTSNPGSRPPTAPMTSTFTRLRSFTSSRRR